MGVKLKWQTEANPREMTFGSKDWEFQKSGIPLCLPRTYSL